MNERPSARWRLVRSLAAKLIFLVAVFAAVPVIVYQNFEAADHDKQTLLLKSVQDQGRLVAAGLQPLLANFSGSTLPTLRQALLQLAGDQQRIRLLFRPTGSSGAAGFYLIAAAPPIEKEYMEAERTDLLETGILERLKDSCEDNRQLAIRYKNPAGQEEILTSVNPIQVASGCWVAVASQSSAGFLGSSVGRPYWQTTELEIAALAYAVLVAAILVIFLGIWRSLHHFTRLARRIKSGEAPAQSFAALNRMPELDVVAEAFDGMVERLRGSAIAIRQAAEENAHAFKAPIAVMAQSLEPIRRALRLADARERRSLELVERSIEKLDGLVATARRMDEAIAESVDPPRRRVDLSQLVEEMLADFSAAAAARGVRLSPRIEPRLCVLGGEELLETVVENILENAVSFSPDQGEIRILLSPVGRRVTFTVEDQGPGVEPGHLQRIFERHFSHRPGVDRPNEGGHFGLGLWLVRRNVEAIGGSVAAENVSPRGLRMMVILPAA
ncbi:MAG TPA: HAMP domain-containing sensor histidine kinase [Candidatus Sulfotelmatobacter sp.]|nr:HAMP domain-containing sensor histidine kinase [Candidatus Sulfotelmatobacter sp.]